MENLLEMQYFWHFFLILIIMLIAMWLLAFTAGDNTLGHYPNYMLRLMLNTIFLVILMILLTQIPIQDITLLLLFFLLLATLVLTETFLMVSPTAIGQIKLLAMLAFLLTLSFWPFILQHNFPGYFYLLLVLINGWFLYLAISTLW